MSYLCIIGCNKTGVMMVTKVLLVVAFFLASYLVGALPFGYLAAKLLKGIDIRQFGSQNVGATNVARVMGKPVGSVVLILDVAKGLAPVLVFAPVAARLVPEFSLLNAKVLCGLGAILGHVFTVFLRFRGGKGVATTCGVLLGLDWKALLVSLAVWLLLVGIWRYVSLGSILAAAVFPVTVIVLHWGNLKSAGFLIFFAVGIASLVIARHRGNIKRLLAGTESKLGEHRPAA